MPISEPSVNQLESQEKNASTAPSGQGDPLPRRFERFVLLSRVARGGMGEVYLATAPGIEGAERPLIVKIIRPDHADDRSFTARFLDEARIQAQLCHPGVAQIVEAATDRSGKPYVVVEHVEGRNLSDVRTRSGQLGLRIGWPQAVALGVCLGEALTHIHERTDPDGRPLEIVHRDLSPQNVMVGYGGELKLIDFGTARGQNRRCQTVAGIVFAKPGYVAPEVANNSPGGIPADLYAFGVVLWELLAGRRFLWGEASEHMAQVGAGKRTLPPLSKMLAAPPELDAILARLTATRVEDRYPSARTATQDLAKILQRGPSLANGDRSVRGRIADLMQRLYPAEPARSRSEFARRVAEWRSVEHRPTLPEPSPAPAEEESPSMLPGTRYRLIQEIGRGAVGVVHEALHVDLGRSVALKVLSPDAMSPESQGRFRAEARAIAQLEHPNLVKIFEFGVCSDGRPFYAMELLDGESLDKRLTRLGRLPLREVVNLGLQACRALQVAHAAGVIHRDIKPANLHLTESGILKVLDFGVAKAGMEPAPKPSEGLSLLGTPEYMAPEQARSVADERTDVYALGSVLYELFTGVLPFAESSPLSMLAAKAERAAEAPSRRLADLALPEALDRILVRALDPRPEARQRDISSLEQELDAVERSASGSASRARRWGPKSVAVGVLLACLAVLVTAGTRHPDQVSEIGHRLMAWSSGSTAPGATRPAIQAPAPRAPAPLAAAAAEPPVIEPDAAEPSLAEASDQSSEDEGDEATQDSPSEPAGPAIDDEVAQILARAQALSRDGRDLPGLALLRRAATAHPESSEILGAYALAAQKNQAWGEAVKVARERAKIDDGPEARLLLARLERATGHRERALELLKQVVRDEAGPPEARALWTSWTGESRVALRD